MTSKLTEYALSIKQPWAALVVCGVKTVEVRRWPSLNQKTVDLDCKYNNLGDVRVRQAIALAIDKKTVMDASIAGYGTVIGTIVVAMYLPIFGILDNF